MEKVQNKRLDEDGANFRFTIYCQGLTPHLNLEGHPSECQPYFFITLDRIFLEKILLIRTQGRRGPHIYCIRNIEWSLQVELERLLEVPE